MIKELVIEQDKFTATSSSELLSTIEKLTDFDILVLNMKNVQLIDSSGVAALLVLRRKLGLKGKQLVILSPSPNVKRVFMIMGINKVLEIVDNLDEVSDNREKK